MPRRLTGLSVALLLATAALRAQQPPAPGVSPPLERYLEALREQAGIPGMSAAIVQDGQITWEYGFGYQDVAARIRATPDTPYVVADRSQTLAAVLLLQCVEQRRIDLDAPASRYGAALPEPAATVRQVLTHTSADPPGDAFLYSPDRFAQLTNVVEWCAPQPYRKSVAHRLLDRLAMKDSVPGTDLVDPTVVPDDLFEAADLERYQKVLARTAIGYKVDGRKRAERNDLPVTGINAATGLVSTVRDLAEFDVALDSSQLLLEDTLNAAWTPAMTNGGASVPFGLGWFVQSYRGERVVWHFGYIPNAYSALILKLPARHTTFILLANSDALSAPFQLASGDVTRSVFAALFLKRAICPLAASC
jgi:CubicO group peptidase (beta-lactamase class C family)